MVKLNQAERRLVQGSMFTQGKAWQWDKKKMDCPRNALARRPLQNPHQPDFHGKFQPEQGHVKGLRLDHTTQKMSDQDQFPSEQ